MPRKAKYVLDIEEAIRDVYERAVEPESMLSGEMQTRYSLIDPLLQSLGWKLSNPTEVRLEYRTDHGKVDYAFFLPGSDRPIMLLEAKKITEGDIEYIPPPVLPGLGVDDDDWIEWSGDMVNKLGSYRSGMKRGFGVLTDGVFWDIYNLNKRGSFEDKRKERISIAHTEDGKGAEALKLLHRRNVVKKFKESKS